MALNDYPQEPAAAADEDEEEAVVDEEEEEKCDALMVDEVRFIC